MQIVILGCGSSMGVPLINCDCDVCVSDNPKNIRTRSSIWIRDMGLSVVVDITPDFRAQALKHKITHVDAIIITHAHYDHIGGLDDLRPYNKGYKIPAFMDLVTLNDLKQKSPHLFKEYNSTFIWPTTSLEPQIIDYYDKFKIKHLEFTAIKQIHGKIFSLGLRWGNNAYSTDFNYLDENALNELKNLDLWITDAMSINKFQTHVNLQEALDYIKLVGPKRSILTHMSHEISYESIVPYGREIIAAFDGLVLDC